MLNEKQEQEVKRLTGFDMKEILKMNKNKFDWEIRVGCRLRGKITDKQFKWLEAMWKLAQEPEPPIMQTLRDLDMIE